MRRGRRNEAKRLWVDLHLVIETRRFLQLEAVTPTECEAGDKLASLVIILVMIMMVMVMVMAMVMVMVMVMMVVMVVMVMMVMEMILVMVMVVVIFIEHFQIPHLALMMGLGKFELRSYQTSSSCYHHC